MKKGILFPLLLMVICICACKRTEYEIPSKSEKLSLLAKNEGLQNGSECTSISYITDIQKYNDGLLIVDGREKIVYNTDLFLNVRRIYNLKDWDYLFPQRIEAFTLFGNKAYLLDNTLEIKILDLETGIAAKQTKIKSNRRSLKGIEFSPDSSFIRDNFFTKFESYMRFDEATARWIKDDKKYLIGVRVDFSKNDTVEYTIDKEVMQYSAFQDDRSFVTVYKDKIIFCFFVSKKVLIYDLAGKLQRVSNTLVDKSVYEEPKYEERNGQQWFKCLPLNRNKIQVSGNSFYQLLLRGKNKEPELIKMNEELIPQKRLELPGNAGGAQYRFLIVGDYLYLYGGYDSIIYIYELN